MLRIALTAAALCVLTPSLAQAQLYSWKDPSGRLIISDVPRDSVVRVLATMPSRCRTLGLPVCLPLIGKDEEHRLDMQVLGRDVVRIQLVFRDNGYYGTRVVPTVDEQPGGKMKVRFNVVPGDLVVWTPPGTGQHVCLVVGGGSDPMLVSHGDDSGPKKLRFSAEDAYQRSHGHGTAIWLTAF